MKRISVGLFVLLLSVGALAQTSAVKIYETERAFEKAVAEKGLNSAFIEFLAPDGVMFFPEAANAQATYRSRPPSPASLTWNPVLINVSSNDVLGYSIGNSVFKGNGINDTNEFYGHYLSVWVRRPNGEYRAVLDAGINHAKPALTPTEWKTTGSAVPELNLKRVSASDSSVGFYETATGDLKKAFKSSLANDAILLREGLEPIVGKRSALKFLDGRPGMFSYAKRKSFVEASDLAYVHSPYTVTDKNGKRLERGNFIQVWRFRDGRWQIVVDMLIPIPTT